MKFIQTWQRFFPVFFFFFSKTFDLLHTNTSRVDTLKYTNQHIWLWFLLMTSRQTNSKMVWYVNKNELNYSHWSKHVGEYLASAMHFRPLIFILRDNTLMFIYHRHIFVLYIIHQNNPVKKSLCCIIPWFLRNRSYRRRAPSYRRHPMKVPSSVISDNFAYRRLAANMSGIIVQKRDKVRVNRFGARCTMPTCFSVVNLREIGGLKEARARKNFSKWAAASAPSWRR